MTHDEAAALCQEHNRDENRRRQWFIKRVAPNDWEVVSVEVEGLGPPGPLKQVIETRPEPSEPPDPRPSIMRNIPPYGPA